MRGAMPRSAPGASRTHCVCVRARADRLVGTLRPEDLVCKASALEPAEVPVRLRMVADLEQRIRHELACALLVRAQPFAAGEERGLDVLLAQVVDDSAVVTGNLARLLAQVEGERDQLAAGRRVSRGGRRRSPARWAGTVRAASSGGGVSKWWSPFLMRLSPGTAASAAGAQQALTTDRSCAVRHRDACKRQDCERGGYGLVADVHDAISKPAAHIAPGPRTNQGSPSALETAACAFPGRRAALRRSPRWQSTPRPPRRARRCRASPDAGRARRWCAWRRAR